MVLRPHSARLTVADFEVLMITAGFAVRGNGGRRWRGFRA